MKLLYKINKTDPEGERSEVLYIYYYFVCLLGHIALPESDHSLIKINADLIRHVCGRKYHKT